MEPHSTHKAPDGGWGWIIVLVSFMAQLLAYGQTQAVGVLYPEWLTVFQEGKGLTAWVGSLVSGIGLVASEYVAVVLFSLYVFWYRKHRSIPIAQKWTKF